MSGRQKATVSATVDPVKELTGAAFMDGAGGAAKQHDVQCV
jgi:hypothetical protein